MPAALGTLAITARGDGNRWYGRISIPLEMAQLINIKEGDRISARWNEDSIVIYGDEHGRIKLPPAKGKTDKKHAFEAATTTLGLKEVRLPQQDVEAAIYQNTIIIKVPEEFLAGEDQKKRKPRKKPIITPPTPPRRIIPPPIIHNKSWGSAAAIVTEGGRSGRQPRPMSLSEIVQLLIEKGEDVSAIGPRIFKLNGKSVTASDLADAANKICACTDQNRIILVMDL